MAIEESNRTHGRSQSRAAIYRDFQATALCPKPKATPYAELYGEKIARRVTNDEIDLLAWIAEHADSLVVDGMTYAVIRMPAYMVDKLARVGEALADLEPGGDLDAGGSSGGSMRAILDVRAGKPDTGDDADWSLDASEQTLDGWGHHPGNADQENTYNEALCQEGISIAGRMADDAECEGDLEAVNEDGDVLDRGEFDDAERDAPVPSLLGYRWGVEPIAGTDPHGRPGVWTPIGRAAR